MSRVCNESRRLNVTGRPPCRRQPKPASTFTAMGFNFTSYVTSRATNASDIAPPSGACTAVKRTELAGRVQLGEYGVYPEGPKPPVWVLTGETPGNRPVKVFARLAKLEAIEAADLPLTDAQASSPGEYGLFVGTGVCGLGRQACSEKCRVKGGGCQSGSGAGAACSSCQPCCCAGATPTLTPVTPGCSASYTKTCEWEGLHLVDLDNNLGSAVRQLVASAAQGVNKGWVAVDAAPQVTSPLDFSPGALLGMQVWDSTVSGTRVANMLADTACTTCIPGTGSAVAKQLSVALKGTVALGPEYNAGTQFFHTSLPVAVQLAATSAVGSTTWILAKLQLLVPKTVCGTTIRTLSAPDAGEALCCLLNDVDNLPATRPEDCTAVESSYTLCYSADDAAEDVALDQAVYSAADRVVFFVASAVPTGNTVATGDAFDAYVGTTRFLVTPYSVTGVPGLSFQQYVSGTPSTALAVSVSEDASAPFPLTASQQAAWGNLYVRVDAVTSGTTGFNVTLYRRDALVSWPFLTGPLTAGSDAFTSTTVSNQSGHTIDIASPPLSYAPGAVPSELGVNYGMAQFVMPAALMLVTDTTSTFFTLAMGGASYKFVLEPSTDYSASPVTFVTQKDGATVQTTSQAEVGTLTDGTDIYKITQVVDQQNWVVQIVRLTTSSC